MLRVVADSIEKSVVAILQLLAEVRYDRRAESAALAAERIRHSWTVQYSMCVADPVREGSGELGPPCLGSAKASFH